MDSMKSLNSSLPSSRPQVTAPPDLLQAFRTAALSVTNLYKSAAADQANARQAGYQDALEDLLKFLDDENLGVQDGEGWRIRQWATQRYDGGSYHQQSEADDDSDHDTKPTTATKLQTNLGNNDEPKDNMLESGTDTEVQEDSISHQTVFRFTGNQNADGVMQTDASSSALANDDQASTSTSPSVRVEVLNRNRAAAKPSSSARHSTRSHPREFTFTAGTKRKLNFPDFFDISNIPDRRDGIGGSKRGRLI